MRRLDLLMLNLLRFFFPRPTHVSYALGDADSAVRASTAGRARQRLLDQGLLQVELDAQADIKQRVHEARENRERAGATQESAEGQRSRAAA